MMYMPSVFGENLLDDFFNDDWFDYQPAYRYRQNAAGLMKTDIKENDKDYEMNVELPGYKKEDLKLELKDGYLTIQAAHNENKDEKDKNGKMVRQERYSGSMQRSFYVGDDLKEEDIHARFVDGVLTIAIPKKEIEQQIPEKKTIAIEG
jgi:HSP20 family protein